MTRRPLSRRRVLGAASALGAAAVLAACSASGPSGPSAAGPTRTIKDINDADVVVPANPARIITLSEPTTDNAIALGVTPIGVASGRGQSTVANYMLGVAGDLPIVGTVGTPNLEAIGAAKPDLILVDGTSVNNDPETLAALAKISPTVFTGYAGGEWTYNLRTCADALNANETCDKLLADYDSRVQTASAALGRAGFLELTYSIIRWQGNSAGLILKELPPGRVLTDLGMRRPENQDRDGNGHSDPVSMENIDQVDADWMFFGTLGGSSVNNPNAGGDLGVQASAEALEQAKAVPGFGELSCVKAGQVIAVDGSQWTSTGGYHLMNGVLDDVVKSFVPGAV